MARLFGRFRATVWFRCLCWNKGMIFHKVETPKDHFTVLLKRARIIFSLYESTWHVSWTYSYHCCKVVFWRWWMTAGLTLWTSCIVCIKTEHAHMFLGQDWSPQPGLVPKRLSLGVLGDAWRRGPILSQKRGNVLDFNCTMEEVHEVNDYRYSYQCTHERGYGNTTGTVV